MKALVCVIGSTVLVGACAAPVPTVTELGTPGVSSAALDVNNAGVIVGFSSPSDGSARVAVEFAQNGNVEALSDLAGSEGCEALAVASTGTIVGACYAAAVLPPSRRAVTWDAAGTVRDLGPVWPGQPGLPDVVPEDINQHGVIVGWVQFEAPREGRTHAWVYDPGSGFQELPAPENARATRAIAINDAGEIVGSAALIEAGSANRMIAVKWTAGDRVFTELPLPSGCVPPLPGRVWGEAADINDKGVIVGHCNSGALIWRAAAEPAAFLPAPPRQPQDTDVGAQAVGVNDAGEVIGRSFHGQGDVVLQRGVAWTPQGRAVDLGQVSPTAINDSGLIVGADGNRAVRVDW